MPRDYESASEYLNDDHSDDAIERAELPAVFPAAPLSVLEIVRSCPPSPELVAMLAKLSVEQCGAGKTNLAVELLSLALCARSAIRDGRSL